MTGARGQDGCAETIVQLSFVNRACGSFGMDEHEKLP